jgi:hypothetical protein
MFKKKIYIYIYKRIESVCLFVRNRTLLNLIGLGLNFLRVLRGTLSSSKGQNIFFSDIFFHFFSGKKFEVFPKLFFCGLVRLNPSNAGSLYLLVLYIFERLLKFDTLVKKVLKIFKQNSNGKKRKKQKR